MPGGLPRGGMFNFQFDWYIIFIFSSFGNHYLLYLLLDVHSPSVVCFHLPGTKSVKRNVNNFQQQEQPVTQKEEINQLKLM